MRGPRKQVLGVTIVAALAALSLTATTATAGITGPCTATIAGVSVANQGTGPTAKPIVVKHNASVPVVLTAKGKLAHIHFTMEFAGISWTVKDKAVSDPTYTDTIPVKNYAKYGVGLYKVNGSGNGAGFSCSGTALVKVEGNPLASIAGIVGLVTLLLGGAGVLAGAFMARGGGGAARVVFTGIAGVFAAFGLLVLLQQAAVIYPTPVVAIVGLVLGGLLGGVAGAAGGRGGRKPVAA